MCHVRSRQRCQLADGRTGGGLLPRNASLRLSYLTYCTANSVWWLQGEAADFDSATSAVSREVPRDIVRIVWRNAAASALLQRSKVCKVSDATANHLQSHSCLMMTYRHGMLAQHYCYAPGVMNVEG